MYTNYKKDMKILLLCLSYLFVSFAGISQTSTETGRKKVLKVTMDTDAGRIKGYIYNVTDSTVTISRDFIAYDDSVVTSCLI